MIRDGKKITLRELWGLNQPKPKAVKAGEAKPAKPTKQPKAIPNNLPEVVCDPTFRPKESEDDDDDDSMPEVDSELITVGGVFYKRCFKTNRCYNVSFHKGDIRVDSFAGIYDGVNVVKK